MFEQDKNELKLVSKVLTDANNRFFLNMNSPTKKYYEMERRKKYDGTFAWKEIKY